MVPGKEDAVRQRHSLWRTRWGPAEAAPPHPHPPFPVLTPNPKRVCTPWGRARYCTHDSIKGGHPRKTDAGEGGSGHLPGGSPSLSASHREVCGCGGVSGPDLRSSIPAAPGSSPAVPWGSRAGRPGRSPPAPSGRGRRHMMAQRFRRSAPWKRRAACTCLQRAQPTLLSSSLKSSRMCQLYLAEHST